MTESWVPSPADPSPGWRADPWFTGQYRWWDGSAWSGDVFPEGVAPYAQGPVVTERPPSERPSMPPPWHRADPPPPPPTWVIQQVSVPPPPLIEPLAAPPARRRSSTAVLASLLVFGIVLGAIIGLAVPESGHKHNAGPLPLPTVTPTPATPSNPPASPAPSPSDSPPALSTTGLLQRFSLRQSDLPTGQQLGLIDGGDDVKHPTLDLCNGKYASESRRVARLQLAAATADATTTISSEAVLYDSPAATVQAFSELQKVAGSCPTTPVTNPTDGSASITRFNARPDRDWPSVAGVQRLAYSITTTDSSGESTTSTVVYLRRGKALLGLYMPKPDPGAAGASVQGKTSAAGITAIFEQRLASVPASSIGA